MVLIQMKSSSLALTFLSSILLLIVIAIIPLGYGNAVIKRYTKEVNGIVWGTGDKTLTAKVQNLPADVEEQRLLLSVYNAQHQAVFNKELHISKDMWGAGFVKAMQVDTDPELEIVFYVYHSRGFYPQNFSDDSQSIGFNFYLDINPATGKLAIKNFNAEASTQARDHAETIISTLNPLTLKLFLFLAAPIIFGVLASVFGKNKKDG
jgi:hypothetical protein